MCQNTPDCKQTDIKNSQNNRNVSSETCFCVCSQFSQAMVQYMVFCSGLDFHFWAEWRGDREEMTSRHRGNGAFHAARPILGSQSSVTNKTRLLSMPAAGKTHTKKREISFPPLTEVLLCFVFFSMPREISPLWFFPPLLLLLLLAPSNGNLRMRRMPRWKRLYPGPD